jgi:hypothetical protein
MRTKTWQRLRNLVLFRLWVTDRTLAAVMPIFALMLFVVVIICILHWLLQ